LYRAVQQRREWMLKEESCLPALSLRSSGIRGQRELVSTDGDGKVAVDKRQLTRDTPSVLSNKVKVSLRSPSTEIQK
jgi:hypothetical protein